MCTIFTEGSVMVVPRQCSGGFTTVHGPLEQEMTREQFQPAEEVFHDVYKSQQCTEWFGKRNKIVYPPLVFQPGT